MTVRDEDIRQRLRLGEDSRWEFKRIKFSGDRPTRPAEGDLADEIVAFANANGGALLCGVTDDGQIPGMTRPQMVALDRLLVEVSTDKIKPSVRIDVHHRELDGRCFLLVDVARGDDLHEREGRSFIRVGETKRQMTGDERLRLAQRRTQNRYLWFDEQPVPETGFDTLDAALWRPLLSAEGAAEPEVALAKLALLAPDESGVRRATVAGVLLCTQHPEWWLPNAAIVATRYRGADRTTGQVDAQEITGPLHRQIADAVAFTVRNMQVAARKVPARIDMPQYSEKAIFEAVVNAVAHRDYAIRGSRIRLSMFADRLELQSPGALPNTLTIEGMELRQATRNQTIASLMGRMGVGEIRGSADRRYFMERRGDGVPVIQRETRELSGRPPVYRLVDDAEILLVLPAAPQDATFSRTVVSVRAEGRPLPGAEVLVLFPNRTWKQAVADENGEAAVELHTTELPMTVFGAASGYAACLVREWLPSRGALALELRALPRGGSIIFPEATGHLPGLKGRLNPVRDTLDRTYLYASNIAIGRGRLQPVHFVPGEELRLTDADGAACLVRILDIAGRSALVEYRQPEPRSALDLQLGGKHVIEQVGVLQWDLDGIADSLHLTAQETKEYFTDGRRVSFILERRICREIIGGRLSPSEGAGFDLIDAYDRKWEVRSITSRGIYFCPSYMVGSGRRFNEAGFFEKLDEIEGYVVSDVTKFPEIPVWKLSVEVVRQWYANRDLGAGTKVSRLRALALLGA